MTLPETLTFIKQGIKNGFKDFFKDATPAVKFWNAIAYIAFIIIAFINIEAAGVISGILSLFVLALVLDEEFEKNPDVHFWPPLSFLFWIGILFGCLAGCIYGLWYITLRPFNNWLNDPYASRWNKFNAYISKPGPNPVRDFFSIEYQKDTSVGRESFFKKDPKRWMKLMKSDSNLSN